MRTLHLHIGVEKTGTTSIQDYLRLNEELVGSRGFLPLRSFGYPNAIKLARIAAEPNRVASLSQAGWSEELRKELRDDVERDLATELDAHPATGHFIVSNEHCSSRLVQPSDVRSLQTFLDGFFDAVRIIVFLRRQDRLAVSGYSTQLRAGATRAAVITAGDHRRPYFDYQRLLTNYSDAFGEDAIRVEVYNESWMDGPSSLDIIRAVVGTSGHGIEPERRNPSLSLATQTLLRRLNEIWRDQGHTPERRARRRLIQVFDEVGTGPGDLPTRFEATAFVARFAEVNEAVRSRWFPDRASLFDDDYSRYPDEPLPPPDVDEVLRVAIDALAALTSNRS